jgi:osmotically-inducible protein OsmY
LNSEDLISHRGSRVSSSRAAPAPSHEGPQGAPVRVPREPAVSAARVVAAAALVVLGLLAAAGCGRRHDVAAPAAATRAPAGDKAVKEVEVKEDPVKTGIAAGDAGLAERVRARLAADPQLRRLSLEVDAEGGRVTLWGHVGAAAERTAAAERVRQTPGVTAVIDLVKVDADRQPRR